MIYNRSVIREGNYLCDLTCYLPTEQWRIANRFLNKVLCGYLVKDEAVQFMDYGGFCRAFARFVVNSTESEGQHIVENIVNALRVIVREPSVKLTNLPLGEGEYIDAYDEDVRNM